MHTSLCTVPQFYGTKTISKMFKYVKLVHYIQWLREIYNSQTSAGMTVKHYQACTAVISTPCLFRWALPSFWCSSIERHAQLILGHRPGLDLWSAALLYIVEPCIRKVTFKVKRFGCENPQTSQPSQQSQTFNMVIVSNPMCCSTGKQWKMFHCYILYGLYMHKHTFSKHRLLEGHSYTNSSHVSSQSETVHPESHVNEM